MPEPVSTTALRANLYKLIDQVIKDGRPLRVRRGESLVVIQREISSRRLDLESLPRRQAIACSPDELIDQGFDDAWGGEL